MAVNVSAFKSIVTPEYGEITDEAQERLWKSENHMTYCQQSNTCGAITKYIF